MTRIRCASCIRVLYTAAGCGRQHGGSRLSVMRKLGVSTLLLLLLMTSLRPLAEKTRHETRESRQRSAAWVESTLKKMTLREKLGQMLMPHYFGVFTSAESAEYKQLLHQVEDNHVGGFIVGTERGPLGIERSQVYPTA